MKIHIAKVEGKDTPVFLLEDVLNEVYPHLKWLASRAFINPGPRAQRAIDAIIPKGRDIASLAGTTDPNQTF